MTIPEEEANDVIILNRDALSFSMGNNAYVLMKDESGEMQETAVTLGVSNDRFIEITSGLNEGDTVYVVVENTTESSSGLASLFSSLTGSTETTTQTNSMPNMGSGMGGGNFGGGNFSGGAPSMR